MWQIEPVTGTRYVHIRNRWRSDQYLNTEKGPLVAGPIATDWLSAMWWWLQ